MSDKMREEFEAWVLRRAENTPAGVYPQLLARCEEDPKDYLQSWVYAAWDGWKASRRDQVIDFTPCNVQHSSYNNVDCYAVSDVVVILGRHGLKVKL